MKVHVKMQTGHRKTNNLTLTLAHTYSPDTHVYIDMYVP